MKWSGGVKKKKISFSNVGKMNPMKVPNLRAAQQKANKRGKTCPRPAFLTPLSTPIGFWSLVNPRTKRGPKKLNHKSKIIEAPRGPVANAAAVFLLFFFCKNGGLAPTAER